jgi:integrase
MDGICGLGVWSRSVGEGDMVALTWRSYDGASVQWIAGKNDERCTAPVAGILKTLLERAPKAHFKVCLNAHGRPWKSANSFRSAFFTCVRQLQRQGLLDPGATFHGLRHTVGVNARADGESDFRVAAALGDRSTAMAQVYGRDADRHAAQSAVLKGVQKRFENMSMETNLETAPPQAAELPVTHCKEMEAWAGIEPACTDLQSAA